jgi:hypothetical protein
MITQFLAKLLGHWWADPERPVKVKSSKKIKKSKIIIKVHRRNKLAKLSRRKNRKIK